MESWNLLRRLKDEGEGAWLVMGDFNEIVQDSEMEGARKRERWQMLRFSECLADCNLEDLGYEGFPFTFSNRRTGEREVRVRLDRFLANWAWKNKFPDAQVRHSFANTSDHNPIVIDLMRRAGSRRTRIDRFEPMWARHVDFKRVLEGYWEEAGNTSNDYESKLSCCLRKLLLWNKRTFGKVGHTIKELKERIIEIRKGRRTEDVAREEYMLSVELDEWLQREEVMWRQRSRTEWLQHGDKNTAFFHAKATQRRKRNHISRLKDAQGRYSESQQHISNIVYDYFSSIFSSQTGITESINGEDFSFVERRITDEMNRDLMRPFTADEVKNALFQMNPTKAPGLDGFHALFFQQNWELIKEDVLSVTLGWLNDGIAKPDLNETLIVLIPKTKVADRMEDLRPISLCKVTMKIITKVLANRLKELMHKIISPNQSAFIQGRLISDNIIVAHELSHFISNSRITRPGFISVKLDLSKAYDRLEWSFLRKMMLTMGFAEGWVEKIMSCVQSVSYRVRINDHVTKRIQPGRGIRQGDPISPYLFLICAEWISMTLEAQRVNGNIKGVKISASAPEVSHLLFADDCLLFLEASNKAVNTIREMLGRYEMIAGQKINGAKSEVVCSAGVPESLKEEIRNQWGMSIVDHHDSYLGLPNHFGRDKSSAFRLLSEKIRRKCIDWKSRILSAAGKETLIKSVLQSIPIYAMSCFRMSKSVCKELVSRVLDFWWDRKEGGRRAHWIRKELLFSKKEEGGLGFKRFEHFNTALLTKQAWRMLTEPELLMSRILRAKYFEGMDLSNAILGNKPSFAWKSIFSVLGLLRQNVVWLESNNEYCWLADSNGKFSVKSAYEASVRMEEIELGNQEESSDNSEVKSFWKWYWKLNVPNKTKIFGWRLYHNGLPTACNLVRRGCMVELQCRLCGMDKESSIHLSKDCWWVKAIFSDFALPEEIWNMDCEDSGYWMWICAKICSTEQFKLLVCGLWLGWQNRNMIVHGKEAWSFSHIKQKLKQLKLEFNKQTIKLFDGTAEDLQSAEGPIIFCDGSWKRGEGLAGICAVLKVRDSILKVKANCIAAGQSPVEAEGYAIELGMKLAVEENIKEVIILSDCADAVSTIFSGLCSALGGWSWLPSCQNMWTNFPNWRLGLISRCSNVEADAWAKKAREECWCWNCDGAVPRLCF